MACQLDELEKCTRRKKTLDSILESLPKTLEEMYDQILSRISPADASGAVKLLLWLAFAKQPLHMDYLAIIVEFDVDTKGFDSDAKLSYSTDVLKICSSLVTRMGDNTVQLAHASVKTYVLEKKRTVHSNIVMDPAMGDHFVGQCCLTYLLHSRESHPIDPFNWSIRKRYQQSLIRYASRYWPKHLNGTNLEPVVLQQMKDLFTLSNFAFQNWVKVYDYDAHRTTGDANHMRSKSMLWCAALHGLTVILEWLLPRAAHQTEILEALYPASLHGHLTIVNMLLAIDSDYQAECVEKAVQGERDSIPLKNKTNTTLRQRFYGYAVQAASEGGHGHIVQLLLERGADVNMASKEHGNALHAASCRGHAAVVKLLLRKGANVNVQGGEYGNAIQAASQGGHNNIVELLLEKGANVNAQGGCNGNALQAASEGGHNSIVQLLLEKGANVNAQGGKYGNALQAASFAENTKIVQLLLERGAGVNVQGGKYKNALQAASYGSNKDIVCLLLERGADVHAQGGTYGNALQAASLWGETIETVELLLEKGADVNAQGGEYGFALQAASYEGHYDVVQLLLERGADVHASGGKYGNALQAASFHGHIDIIQLLLKSGAKASYSIPATFSHSDHGYQMTLCNPLQAACLDGHISIAELLLDHGVEQEHLDTALQSALAKGHQHIVDLLLDHGAKQK